MIGLDSNVVVRYLVQDDRAQAATATAALDALTEADPGYLSLVTVAEVYWVLRRAYGYHAAVCTRSVAELLEVRELSLAEPSLVRTALELAGQGADFADALIAESGRRAGCEHTLTFDRRAATQLGAMTLLG